jgi:RND family efflux transporter MFP subunit
MANGQLVSAGQVVAQVAPLDALIADVDLVGQDIARVHVGSEARVNFHAWEGKYFPGRLRRLAPVIDAKTRALGAEVEIKNPQGALRPGMFVEVSIVVERRDNIPLVPRRAVSVRGGKSVVFIYTGERVAQRAIELGLADEDVVEARTGLTAGERIVVSGIETLADQTRVRVIGL